MKVLKMWFVSHSSSWAPAMVDSAVKNTVFLEGLDFKSWGAGDEAGIQKDEYHPPGLVNWWEAVHS